MPVLASHSPRTTHWSWGWTCSRGTEVSLLRQDLWVKSLLSCPSQGWISMDVLSQPWPSSLRGDLLAPGLLLARGKASLDPVLQAGGGWVHRSAQRSSRWPMLHSGAGSCLSPRLPPGISSGLLSACGHRWLRRSSALMDFKPPSPLRDISMERRWFQCSGVVVQTGPELWIRERLILYFGDGKCYAPRAESLGWGSSYTYPVLTQRLPGIFTQR